ncbi:MAG: hypothetical protein WBL67_15270 [Nitrososphaeraceae archaeon]
MNIAYVYEDDPLFERKIENATAGLKPACKKILRRVSKTNAIIIVDYITSEGVIRQHRLNLIGIILQIYLTVF